MQAVFSLIFSVIPMLLYLRGVWLLDRYDREPLTLLLANFLWGALGAVFFGVLFSVLVSALLGTGDWGDTVLVAPVVEELVKGVFLLWTVRDRRFDNITDGVVYGMAIGLGFGMSENFMYFLGADTATAWLGIVIIRTLFSAVLHAMATGTLGAFIGWGKFRGPVTRLSAGMAGLLIAIWMHMTWNGNVIDGTGIGMIVAMLFIVASVVVILGVMQTALLAESRLIRRELTEEVESGHIPVHHLQYLPSSNRRKMPGWLPPSVDQKSYVQLATRLAFRKNQARLCAAPLRDAYEREVAEIRARIDDLFASERSAPWAGLY